MALETKSINASVDVPSWSRRVMSTGVFLSLFGLINGFLIWGLFSLLSYQTKAQRELVDPALWPSAQDNVPFILTAFAATLPILGIWWLILVSRSFEGGLRRAIGLAFTCIIIIALSLALVSGGAKAMFATMVLVFVVGLIFLPLIALQTFLCLWISGIWFSKR